MCVCVLHKLARISVALQNLICPLHGIERTKIDLKHILNYIGMH